MEVGERHYFLRAFLTPIKVEIEKLHGGIVLFLSPRKELEKAVKIEPGN